MAPPFAAEKIDSPQVSAKERAKRVLEQSVDGSMVLLHDFPENSNTVEAMDIMIPELKNRRFGFITVSELFQRKGIPVKTTPGTIYSAVQQKIESI